MTAAAGSGWSRAATSWCRACSSTAAPTSCRTPTSGSSSRSPTSDRFTLIGTTDDRSTGDPDDVRITPEETDYLCRVVNRYFRRADHARRDVVWSYAGVRPLHDDDSGDPSAVTRDYVFDLDAARRQAAAALGLRRQDHDLPQARRARARQAPAGHGLRAGPGPPRRTLPGGDIPNADFDGFLEHFEARHPRLDQGLVAAPRPRLRHAGRARRGRGEGARRARAGVAPGLYEASSPIWCATSGRARPRTCCGGAASSACSSIRRRRPVCGPGCSARRARTRRRWRGTPAPGRVLPGRRPTLPPPDQPRARDRAQRAARADAGRQDHADAPDGGARPAERGPRPARRPRRHR